MNENVTYKQPGCGGFSTCVGLIIISIAALVVFTKRRFIK